jgi:hypothetical protein
MFLLTLLSDIYGDLTQGRYSKEVATFRTCTKAHKAKDVVELN